MNLDKVFPRYTQFNPMAKVWCLTPEVNGCMHRFFDTCPISPSGRLAVFFKMPFENRSPKPGEPGEIVVLSNNLK